MSDDFLDPRFLEEYVRKAKAAWRSHAQAMTWEEKVAAIERMWERDRLLKESREAFHAERASALKQEKPEKPEKPSDL
jgi:hypothetical protein